MEAHFDIDLTLYSAEAGGRKEAISGEGFACPCLLDRENKIFADCRLILHGQIIAPGETKRVGIRFSHEPAAAMFFAARVFRLWDGRPIGEAIVVKA